GIFWQPLKSIISSNSDSISTSNFAFETLIKSASINLTEENLLIRVRNNALVTGLDQVEIVALNFSVEDEINSETFSVLTPEGFPAPNERDFVTNLNKR